MLGPWGPATTGREQVEPAVKEKMRTAEATVRSSISTIRKYAVPILTQHNDVAFLRCGATVSVDIGLLLPLSCCNWLPSSPCFRHCYPNYCPLITSALAHPSVPYHPCRFYNHLFEIAPSVRPLFRESMKVQGRALVKMIDVAVSLVDDLPKLVPALQDLAKRHVKYGVRVPHYAVVGEALLYALKTCLGEEQATSEVMHAWLTVYSVMISVILPTAWEEEHRLKRVAEEEKRKTGGNTGMCAGKAAVSVAAAPEAPPPKASPAASSESSSSSASAVASAKVGAAAQIQAAA